MPCLLPSFTLLAAMAAILEAAGSTTFAPVKTFLAVASSAAHFTVSYLLKATTKDENHRMAWLKGCHAGVRGVAVLQRQYLHRLCGTEVPQR